MPSRPEISVRANANVMHFRDGLTYTDVPHTLQIRGLVKAGLLTRIPKARAAKEVTDADGGSDA